MDKYCTPAFIQELTQVKTSAEKCMTDTASKLTACYADAKLLLPATTPYLPELGKCTTSNVVKEEAIEE